MFGRTPVAHPSSRHRLFQNTVIWLCVIMLALQPLETLAAVQPRVSAESAEQRRVSTDFAEKGWTAALRDQSQAPAGLVSAALFGALPAPTGNGGSNSVSTALAHLERLQQVNPTPNRFVGSASDSESGHSSWSGFGGFGGGGAPVGSPALALLLPQTSDPEPANRLPGPYTYASHPPMQGNGGTSALPGANPGLFAAWLLGLEASEDPGGLIGLGQAIVRVFLYVACVLDGECRASLTELQALGEELGSAAQVTMRWTGRLLSRAADLWPLLPNIPRPLADLMSLGLGFVPVVGDLLDLYAGLTGYDPITGERLPEWAQTLALAAVFMPLVSASQLRYADDALSYVDEALDFEQDVGRYINKGCSFSAETTVQTEGGPQAIAEVEAGDQVLAWDEQSETTGYYTVTVVWTHTDPTVVRLTIDGETIETTPEHPFFVTEEGWTPAEALTVGNRVRKANGDAGVVQRVTLSDRPQTMYNLTVADAHTFFVGDGQWLVHNACRWLGEGDAPSHGEALAHFADEVHRQITRYWPKRQSTTAVAEINGQIYVSSHGDSRAAKDLVDISLQEGYTYVASGADHAEVALYEILHGSPDFIGIGVSHRSGPCPICQNFFFERGYVDVFWTGEWTH